MNQFTIYKNYYYLIKVLSNENQMKITHAILEYMFDDIEPDFNEEDGNIFYVWTNLKMALDTSKNKSKNAIKPSNSNKKAKKSKQNQNEIKSKSNENQNEIKTKTNNIFIFLISNFNYLKDRGLLRGKIEEWLEYKNQRKDYYTERGFKSFLTQIQNNCEKYGDKSVIELIDECMANNYKGIVFEKLEKKQRNTKQSTLPSWFDKDFDEEEGFFTNEERESFKSN